MTAEDLPAVLCWDVSHAKRCLRDKPLALLQDALRLESQARRPRKRLLAWITSRILSSMPPPPRNREPKTENSEPKTHGGARPGAGRDPAPYVRKNVTIELPEPLIAKWDAHCAKKKLSRAESLAGWLKWKKPGKTRRRCAETMRLGDSEV